MGLAKLSALEASKAIREGDISAEAYAQALIYQVSEGADLNAFIEFDPQRVLEAARDVDVRRKNGEALGSLAAIPLGVKDNIETKGIPTTAGTPLLVGYIPHQNAEVISSLQSAGASILGKTNLHELAYGITNNNPFRGPARNPHDPLRIPGGSSGGSAVAVACHMTPIALGTDTGGSVRIPASLCGTVGFRPSVGRWSQVGVTPISATRDTVGPITRTVGDAAMVDAVVTSDATFSPRSLRGLRLGVPRRPFWENLDPETERLCSATLDLLAEHGAELIEANDVRISELDQATAFPIALYETATQLPDFLRERGIEATFQEIAEQCVSEDVRSILTGFAASLPEFKIKYQEAVRKLRPFLMRCYEETFKNSRVDAMIFPTTPAPAPKIGEDYSFVLNGKEAQTFATFVRNTGPGTVAGIPGISIPAGVTRTGLPVGIELDARFGHDRDLLGIAMAIEMAIRSDHEPGCGE